MVGAVVGGSMTVVVMRVMVVMMMFIRIIIIIIIILILIIVIIIKIIIIIIIIIIVIIIIIIIIIVIIVIIRLLGPNTTVYKLSKTSFRSSRLPFSLHSYCEQSLPHILLAAATKHLHRNYGLALKKKLHNNAEGNKLNVDPF